MKFFKKVLYSLYPKILIAQILYLVLMIFFLWYCLIHNTAYKYLVIDWEILFFIVLALLFTSFFIPKIFKIVFYKPRYNSQSSARIALSFFVFLSIFSQFIVLKEQVLYILGKTYKANNVYEIQEHPESSFFIFNSNIELSGVQDAYYINTSYSGKSKNTFNIDIYATKPLKHNNQTVAVFCKRYQTDYSGRQSEAEAQRLVDKDLESAKSSFRNLNIQTTDTLRRIYKKFDIEKFYSSFRLIPNEYKKDYDLLLHSDTTIYSYKRKGFIIFTGFAIFVNLILVLFLSTGIRFKD